MQRTAFISVSDKTGVVPFAAGLIDLGFTIVSSGGTAAALRAAELPVTPVSDRTGFPEILDGRVKTLHPHVHGGILADRRKPDHEKQLSELGIEPFHLVCVNLYPFRETLAAGADEDTIIEHIDIGGPTLVRAAAKNFHNVVIVVDPSDYDPILERLRDGDVSLDMRRELARKAFHHTAAYDAAIARWFNQTTNVTFPDRLVLSLEKAMGLRYGENPHQQAAFYREESAPAATLPHLIQHQGKELSYNNIMDTDAAVAMAREFEEPAAVIVKHANPCGIGRDPKDIHVAFERAHRTDPQSAFGGIIALNRPVDLALADTIAANFVEVVIAPGYTDDARKRFARKRNLRILELPITPNPAPYMDWKRIRGGLLVQEADVHPEVPENWHVATRCQPDEGTFRALAFAWKVVKHVKSNAIVFCAPDETVAIGAGQMSRVDSVRIAVTKANKPIAGSVLASDAFFPFRDSIDAAAAHGVTAIIQPGGSVRDNEVIQAAEEHGIPMVFTGMRHFRH